MNGEKWTEAMQEAFGRAAQNALASESTDC